MAVSLRPLWDRFPFAARLLVTASVALMVAGLAMLYVSARGEAEESSRDLALHLKEELAILPQVLAETVVIGDYATLRQTLERHAARREISAILFRDAEGGRMEERSDSQPRLAPAWFAAWSGLADREGEVALEVGGRRYGVLSVTLSATTSVNRVWGRLKQHLSILLLAVGLDFLGIWLVLRNGLKPLADLSRGADALAGGDFDRRIPLHGSRELQLVIAAFNHMADKVAATQSDLRREAERLRLDASVLEHSLNGIVITDARERIVEVNPAFSDITGYSREEIIGRTPRLLSSGRHDTAFYAAMWHAITRDGHWHGEVWNRHKNGEIYPELLSIVPVRDDQGVTTHYVGIFTDIRDIKVKEESLAFMAHYDPLTGLPNRQLLADRMNVALAQAARTGENLAVCYLDLDGFKPVNDTYGHAAGDRLLMEMARRMREVVRGGDTVARLGGDEFVLLVTEIGDSAECEAILQRLEENLSLPFIVDDHVFSVTASIGVTLYPDDAGDADTLLRHADHALYAAKEAGRARWHFFDPRHDHAVKHRRESLGRLEQALEEREFQLYYQPKVNMHSGEVVGMEALIRWSHPERGVLPPGDFLSLLADSELEIRLGEWVIAAALAQMDAWRKQGLDLAVSVNIAPPHLARDDFAERLRYLLARHPGLPANRLELEVLESAALADLDHAGRLIEACRRLGVTFALDDFGTGYAMLTYLRRLPADAIKIDQSFVRDMLEDGGDLAIVEGVIGLANAFHLAVIAEGVETVEHGATLLHLGCELAQGYAIARPMPGEAVPGWIATWQPDRLWRAVSTGWTRTDIILHGAEMDHRMWVNEIESWLTANGAPPPQLDERMCRFGRWYHGPGRLQYGQVEAFRAIDPIHRQVHVLGDEIIRLQGAGRSADAHALLLELHARRDELIQTLHRLGQERT